MWSTIFSHCDDVHDTLVWMLEFKWDMIDCDEIKRMLGDDFRNFDNYITVVRNMFYKGVERIKRDAIRKAIEMKIIPELSNIIVSYI